MKPSETRHRHGIRARAASRLIVKLRSSARKRLRRARTAKVTMEFTVEDASRAVPPDLGPAHAEALRTGRALTSDGRAHC